jgi:ATP-dependent Clp protease protease subunit
MKTPLPNKPIRIVEGNAKPHEPFWRFVDAAESQSGQNEMELYGPISEYSWIGDEITPKKFKGDLYTFGKGGPILLKIDSPGGDPFAASTMRAIMTEYPGEITVRVDGIAASAAVIVAIAGKTIKIMDSAYMMIHDPLVLVLGATLNIQELEEIRNVLQIIKNGIIPVYAARTGLSEDEITQMMTAETWMDAREAVKFGFADEIIEGGQKKAPVQNVAYVNLLHAFANAPAELLEQHQMIDAVAIHSPTPDPSSNANTAFGEGGDTHPTTPEAVEATVIEPIPSEGNQPASVGGQEAETEAGSSKLKVESEKQELDESQKTQVRIASHARQLELAENQVLKGAPIMNIREQMAQRAAKIARARELANLADTEVRDFSDEERIEYLAALDEAQKTGEKITQAQTEREALQNAEQSLTGLSSTPAKPAPGAVVKTIKRSEYDKLESLDQSAFVKNSGKVED